MSDLRAGIVRLHQEGNSQAEISRLLNVNKMTVSRAIKRFEETGSNEDRPRSGRPVTATTDENMQLIADKICYCNDHEEGHIHSKTDSKRNLATELGISASSALRIIHEAFEMKSRKTAEGQLLNDNAKEKRLTRCKRLARRFAANRQRNILFTDEKWFDIEQSRNSQNDRIWSANPLPPQLKFVERTQKPKQVMVWAGVSYDAKTPLIFVPQGVKMSYGAYCFVFLANIILFSSVFGMYKYFKGDYDDSSSFW